jgi:hypothetical protein
MPGINDDVYPMSVHVEGGYGAIWHGVKVFRKMKGDMF